MTMMHAWVIDRSSASGARFATVPRPDPAPGDAVVSVRAISVNSGDVHGALAHGEEGTVPGWEAAGIVSRAASDGSGPPVGTPVVTFGYDGAWAEYRAVPTSALARVPERTDLAAVATVPVAGVSALSALDRLGPLLGRRVLVIGATGGVGRYVVQLAHRGGAEVIAVVSDPEKQAQELHRLGARRVVSNRQLLAGDCDTVVDGAVDMVGGSLLVAGFTRLARDGTLISLGHLSPEPESFDPGVLLSNQGQDNRKIVTFFMPESTDQVRAMSWLAGQVAEGALDPGIAWRGGWAKVEEAIERLRSGRLHGKAVLDVGEDPTPSGAGG